jgi:Mn-dependent DtxR family transcriptional regulator
MKKDINLVWKKFEDNKISHSATHYLFTIHELLEKFGYARMVDISKKLKITA